MSRRRPGQGVVGPVGGGHAGEGGAGANTIIPIDVMNFAQRLVALRKGRGLTQHAWADRVGIHVSNIRRYEAASSQPNSRRAAQRRAGTSADSLLFASTRTNGGPDDDLRLQFEATRTLDDDEKERLKALLEGFLLRHDARRWTNAS